MRTHFRRYHWWARTPCAAGNLGRAAHSEVVSSCAFGLVAVFHALWAVSGRDVAEPALLRARRLLGRRVGRQPPDQGPEILAELVGQGPSRDPDRVGRVDDFAADPDVPVLRKGLRQGVLVDHDLHAVPGLLLTGLDVDDSGVFAVEHKEVGPAAQSRGSSPQPEGVLPFDVDGVAAVFRFLPLLVQQRRVAHQPLGLVEVGGLLGPFDVMGFEPDGPLAGVFAGQEAGQPGGPDVG